jgi:hypothetical protein
VAGVGRGLPDEVTGVNLREYDDAPAGYRFKRHDE